MSNQTSGLSNLLSMTLDELADLPENKPFPPGVYEVSVGFSTKIINDKPTVFLNLTHLATKELANSLDTSPNPGDESSIMFMLANNDGAVNEFSQGKLKNIWKALAPVASGNTFEEFMDSAKGVNCFVVLKLRENTKSPGTFTQDLVTIIPS